jgi:hypothetical protein
MLRKTFRNKSSGEFFEARVYCPRSVRQYSKLLNRWLSHKECAVLIASGKIVAKKIAAGDDFLGAFLNSLEVIRRHIPVGEESDWLDEQGVESWVVLPKPIPFSWGYSLFKRISDLSDREEAKHIAAIEKRRLKFEAKKTKNRGK